MSVDMCDGERVINWFIDYLTSLDVQDILFPFDSIQAFFNRIHHGFMRSLLDSFPKRKKIWITLVGHREVYELVPSHNL